jgi:hypothetical protein
MEKHSQRNLATAQGCEEAEKKKRDFGSQVTCLASFCLRCLSQLMASMLLRGCARGDELSCHVSEWFLKLKAD